MNDEPPTSFDTVGDSPVEARIVAWVLGEASHFEAAELERLCEERPELLVFRRRMRALHGLLTEAEATAPNDSWKLSPEKRQILDEIFGEEKTPQLTPHTDLHTYRSRRRVLLGLAACLVLTAVVIGIISPIDRIGPISSKIAYSETTTPNPTPAPSLQEFNKAVRDQEDKVEESRKLLATIVRTRGIIYKGQDSFYGQSGVDEDQGARTALQTFNELEQSKMQLESQINSLLKYDREQQMAYTSGIDLPNNEIKELLPRYQEAKREIEKQKIEGLGENHPTTLAKEAELNRIKKKLDEGVVNMRTTLQAQLDIVSDRLSSVEVMKDTSRGDAIKRGLGAQDYVDAKRDFERDQQLLQAMRLKQVELMVASEASSQGLATNTVTPKAPTAPGQYSVEPMALPRVRGMVQEKEQTQLAKQSAQRQAGAEPAIAAADAQLPELADSTSTTPLPSIVESQLGRGQLSGALGGRKISAWAGDAREGSGKTHSVPLSGEVYNLSSIKTADGSVFEKAKELRKAGKYAEARSQLEGIIAAEPNNTEAKSELAYLEDPIRTNSALTDDHTRAELLSQTAAAWELSVPTDGKKKPESDESAKTPEEDIVFSDPAKLDIIREFQYPTEFEPTQMDLYSDSSKIGETGELNYNLHAGYTSEYLFRGVDLGKDATPAPALVDLMEETATSETPYSTFSLNISDASFQLAKAALAKGERPDPAAIKPEQFYNAVDYGDPAPPLGESVAATIEQAAHPVIPARNLVRVALRTASVGRSAIQPLRLTLLVDQSGSMAREDRRASMEHALTQLGILLTRNDTITVIGFSRTSRLLADGMPGDQAAKLSDLVNQAASEGGTNLEEAMKLGGQLAERHYLAAAQNRIVLFTDGAANLGDADPARLVAQVKSFRQKGLAFDIAGIGADGLNDRLLSELARNGNGRYYVVGNEKNDSFARQLAGAFRPAAENVKVQVSFNPQRVKSYKLIGFEKDRLKTEDFRNDAVDAAELAAEEAGVAIYQVEPITDGTGELGEVSVRFRDTATSEMVERTWTMHHESAAPAFDRATPSMQLAGLSLLAAEKLRGGPLGAAIDFNQHSGSSSLVKEFYGSSPRVAEMLQVIDTLR